MSIARSFAKAAGNQPKRTYAAFHEDEIRLVARRGRVAIAAGTSNYWYVEMPGKWDPAWEPVGRAMNRQGGRFGELDGRKVTRISKYVAKHIAEDIKGHLNTPLAIKERVGDLVEAMRIAWRRTANNNHLQPVARAAPKWIVASDAMQARLAAVIPAGKKLGDFQEGAVEAIEEADGRLLIADEQGLGKTPEAIAWFLIHPEIRPVFVCAPNSVCGKWAKEFEDWGSKLGIKAVAYQAEIHDPNRATSEKRRKAALANPIPPCDVLIVGYGALDGREDLFRSVPWGGFVVDESHYAKNSETIRTKALLDIMRRPGAVPCITLSGTPMPNKASELWVPILMTRPEALGVTPDTPADLVKEGEKRFWKEHCYLGTKSIKIPNRKDRDGNDLFTTKDIEGVADPEFLYDLLTRDTTLDGRPMKPVMLRRLKRDVTTLPSKEIVHVNIKPEDADAIARLIKGVQDADEGEAEEIAFSALRKETGLQKVSAAVDRISGYVRSGEPVVVFSHHYEVHDAIIAKLDAMGITHVAVTGKMNDRDRDASVEKFKKGEAEVCLCTQAAREGINLARACKLLIIEREVVPGWELQAEDRIHRLPQTRACTIEYLHLMESLDPVIGRIIDRKKRDIRNGIEGVAQWNSDESLATSIVHVVQDLGVEPAAVASA